jgi:hypothetical protein
MTQTLILMCPICGSEAAETLGVTGSINTSSNAAVILQCDDCSTVYLSPRPNQATGLAKPPLTPVLTVRRVKRWTTGTSHIARVLCVDCLGEAELEVVRSAGASGWSVESIDSIELIEGINTDKVNGHYDLILMLRSLESASQPVALLQQLVPLLGDAGTIVIVTDNAGSSCFNVFGGRHWSPYRFPLTLQHFTKESLEALYRKSGLAVLSVHSSSSARVWMESCAVGLRDWGFAACATHVLENRWFLPTVLATVVEGVAQTRGRGSILVSRVTKVRD